MDLYVSSYKPRDMMPNTFGDHFTDMAQPLFRSLVDVTFLTGKGQREKKGV